MQYNRSAYVIYPVTTYATQHVSRATIFCIWRLSDRTYSGVFVCSKVVPNVAQTWPEGKFKVSKADSLPVLK